MGLPSVRRPVRIDSRCAKAESSACHKIDWIARAFRFLLMILAILSAGFVLLHQTRLRRPRHRREDQRTVLRYCDREDQQRSYLFLYRAARNVAFSVVFHGHVER